MLATLNIPLDICSHYSICTPIVHDIIIGTSTGTGSGSCYIIRAGDPPTKVNATKFFYTNDHIVFYNNTSHFIYNISAGTLIKVNKILCSGHLQYFDIIRLYSSAGRVKIVKNITNEDIETVQTTDTALRFCIHAGYKIWIESCTKVTLYNGHTHESSSVEEVYVLEHLVNDPDYIYLSITDARRDVRVYRIKKDGSINSDAPLFHNNIPAFEYNRNEGVTVLTHIC